MSVHVCKCEHNGRTEYHIRYPGMTEHNAQNLADQINAGRYTAPQAQTAQESERVDVAWRTNVAMAVYNQARRELNNSIGSWISNHIGSWVSFEIDERQRIMDAIKPFMPAPQAQQPRKAVKLSDYELVSHYCAIADGKEWAIGGLSDAVPFARAIEQAVLKKNGVKE